MLMWVISFFLIDVERFNNKKQLINYVFHISSLLLFIISISILIGYENDCEWVLAWLRLK